MGMWVFIVLQYYPYSENVFSLPHLSCQCYCLSTVITLTQEGKWWSSLFSGSKLTVRAVSVGSLGSRARVLRHKIWSLSYKIYLDWNISTWDKVWLEFQNLGFQPNLGIWHKFPFGKIEKQTFCVLTLNPNRFQLFRFALFWAPMPSCCNFSGKLVLLFRALVCSVPLFHVFLCVPQLTLQTL